MIKQKIQNYEKSTTIGKLTNNIAKIREKPLKLLNLLLPSISLYFNLDRDNYFVSRDLYKEFVNQIVDLGYQKCITTKDNFSFIKEFNPLVNSKFLLLPIRNLTYLLLSMN